MRRSRPAVPAALALALLAAAAAAAAAPRLEIAERGPPVLTALPPILDDPAVAEQLTTGLTTSFDFRLGPRRRRDRAVAARVLVRYELWDEVFQVAAAAGGTVERRTVASLDELRQWWRALRLAVPDAGGAAWVRLDVMPFSQAERDDAQRWFSDSLDQAAAPPSERVQRSADEAPGGLSLLNLLLATSIERRPLLSYRFPLDPPREPR